MKECCEGKTTPYCPECGANLKAYSLLGLLEELVKRKSKAVKTLNHWAALATKPFSNQAEGKKINRAVVRNEARVEQLKEWIGLVSEKITPTD